MADHGIGPKIVTDAVVKDVVLDPNSDKFTDIQVPDDLLVVDLGLRPFGKAPNMIQRITN